MKISIEMHLKCMVLCATLACSQWTYLHIFTLCECGCPCLQVWDNLILFCFSLTSHSLLSFTPIPATLYWYKMYMQWNAQILRVRLAVSQPVNPCNNQKIQCFLYIKIFCSHERVTMPPPQATTLLIFITIC